MNFLKTHIPEVVLIQPRIFKDERGYFFESFNFELFKKNIGRIDFIQDNEAKSTKGVLRGLHYQIPPVAQSKLVRVIWGKILDIAVDIRRGSPTFGQHVAVELDGDEKTQLFIPKGFAHGYLVLSEEALVAYKVDDVYSKAHERGIRFNDPDLNIDWGMSMDSITCSMRDANLSLFKEAEVFK